MVKVSVIKISWVLTVSRVINIITVFLPIFFIKTGEASDLAGNLAGWWMVFFILLFLIQVIFIKRYKDIGSIYIKPDCIEIEIRPSPSKTVYLTEITRIDIEYNGFHGDDSGNYSLLPFYVSFGKKEGIGKISIKCKSNKIKINILFTINTFQEINSMFALYSEQGVEIQAT